MIVAIERTKFTYLYKYNQIRVDINQLIDRSTSDLKDMLSNDLSSLIQLFNIALPLFEQDHEIILLEIDKSKINLQDGVLISFDSIHCIYPLTKTGLQLLVGKINDDFILEPPVFENAIEALRFRRSMASRSATSVKLLIHYNLDALLQKSMLSLIESAVEKNLLDKSKPQVFNTFLEHLIAYNKTPSYIPDGNIEHICKIGAIAIKYLGKQEEVFTNGPFYKSIIKYKSKINSHSFLTSYLDFNSIADSELKSSIEKMVDIISKDYTGIDIFKVSYFFLAFKSFLNKHDNNIELLNNEIEALIENDKQIASFVMAMLGYTFSIESIYEGLHKISNAPLLKSTIRNKAAEQKAKRERADMDQQRESVNNVPEPSFEKETIKDVKVVIESGIVETIPNDPIEKIEETIINKPFETVAESIVIYEVNKPRSKEEDSVINKTGAILKQEVRNIFVNDDLEKKSVGKEMVTIQIFKTYLSKEMAKPKQKIWFQFLDYYFPNKNEELSFESLELMFDSNIDLKEKLFKSKKEKESIRAFFIR